MGFWRAVAAAIKTALNAVWIIVRTPLGWIWQRQAPPVTPAEHVASLPRWATGDNGLQDPEDERIDKLMRNYICMRMANRLLPPDKQEALPSLHGLPSELAQWVRRLTDSEVRTFIESAHTDIARHIRAPSYSTRLPIPFLPPVLSAQQYARLDRIDAVTPPADTKASGRSTSGGGGLKGIKTPESALMSEIDAALDDFKMRLGGSAPRPR